MREALEKTLPGVGIKYGCIEHLLVDIPWSNPSKGIAVQCKGVLVLLEPPGENAGVYTPETVQAALESTLKDKAKTLEDWHTKHAQQIKGKKETGLFSRMVSSVTAKLSPLIVNNLRVELTDLHVRFEDTSACAAPLCVGAMVQSLTVCTATSDWTEGSAAADKGKDENGVVRKLMHLQSFAVYADPHFSAVSTCGDTHMQTDFMRRVLRDPRQMGLEMVLEPVSLKVRLSLSGAGSAVKAGLDMTALALTLSDHQVIALTALGKRVMGIHPLSTYVDRQAVQQKAMHINRESKSAYVNLYYRTLGCDVGARTSPLSSDERDKKALLEKWIPSADLIKYREIAIAALKEHGVADLAQMGKKERKAALAQVPMELLEGEIVRIGMLGPTLTKEAQEAQRVREEMEAEGKARKGKTVTLDFSMESVDIQVNEHVLDPSAPMQTALDVIKSQGAVAEQQRQAVTDVGSPYTIAPFGSFHLEGLDLDNVLSASKQLTGSASIKCISLTDDSVDSGAVYPEIISTLNRGDVQAGTQLSSFLSVKYDVNMQAKRNLGSVTVQSLPLLVVVPPAFVTRAQRLGDRITSSMAQIRTEGELSPLPPSASLAESPTGAQSTLDLDTQAVSDFAQSIFSTAAQQVRTMHLDVSIAAPILAVPSACYPGDTDCGVLVVNLGSLSVKDSPSSAVFSQKLAGPKEEGTGRPLSYDTYSLAFQDTEVCFCPSHAAFVQFVDAVAPSAPPVPREAGVLSILSGLSTELFVARSLGGVDVPRIHLYAALDGLSLTVTGESLRGGSRVIHNLTGALSSKRDMMMGSLSPDAASPAPSAETHTDTEPITTPTTTEVDWTEAVSAVFRADGVDQSILDTFCFSVLDFSVHRLGVTFDDDMGQREFSAGMTGVEGRVAVHATRTEGSVSVGQVQVLGYKGDPLVTAGSQQGGDNATKFLSLSYTAPTSVAAMLSGGTTQDTPCQDVHLDVSLISVLLARESLNRLTRLAEETTRMVQDEAGAAVAALTDAVSQGGNAIQELKQQVDNSVFEQIRALPPLTPGFRHLLAPSNPSIRASFDVAGISTHLRAEGPVTTVDVTKVCGTVLLTPDGTTHCDVCLGGVTVTDGRQDVYRGRIVSTLPTDTVTEDTPSLMRVTFSQSPSSGYASEVALELQQRLCVVYSAEYVTRVSEFFSAQEGDAEGIASMISASEEYVGAASATMAASLVSQAEPSLVNISVTGLVPEVIVPWMDAGSDHISISGTTLEMSTQYTISDDGTSEYPCKEISCIVSGIQGQTVVGDTSQSFLTPFGMGVTLESPIECPASESADVADTVVKLVIGESDQSNNAQPVSMTLSKEQYLFLASFADEGTNIGGQSVPDAHDAKAEPEEEGDASVNVLVSKVDDLVTAVPDVGATLSCEIACPSVLLRLLTDTDGVSEGSFDCVVKGLSAQVSQSGTETSCGVMIGQEVSVRDNTTTSQIDTAFRSLIALHQEGDKLPVSLKVKLDATSGNITVSGHTSTLAVTAVPCSLSALGDFFATETPVPVYDTATYSPSLEPTTLSLADEGVSLGEASELGMVQGDPGALEIVVSAESVVTPGTTGVFASLAKYLPTHYAPKAERGETALPSLGGGVSLSLAKPSLTACSTLLGRGKGMGATVFVDIASKLRVSLPTQASSGNAPVVSLGTSASVALTLTKHLYERGAIQDIDLHASMHTLSLHTYNQPRHRNDLPVLACGPVKVVVSMQSLDPCVASVSSAFPQSSDTSPESGLVAASFICDQYSSATFMDVSATVEKTVDVSLSGAQMHTVLSALNGLSAVAPATSTPSSGAESEGEPSAKGLLSSTEEAESITVQPSKAPVFMNATVQTACMDILLRSALNHPLIELSVPTVALSAAMRQTDLSAEIVSGLRVRYYDHSALGYNNLLQPVILTASLAQSLSTQAIRGKDRQVEGTSVSMTVAGADQGTVYLHLPEDAICALAAAGEVLNTAFEQATNTDSQHSAADEGISEFLMTNQTGLPVLVVARPATTPPDSYVHCVSEVLSDGCLGAVNTVESAQQVSEAVGLAVDSVTAGCAFSVLRTKASEGLDLAVEDVEDAEGVPKTEVDILFGRPFQPLLGVPVSQPGEYVYYVKSASATGAAATAGYPVFVTVALTGIQTTVSITSKYAVRNRFQTDVKVRVSTSQLLEGRPVESVLVPGEVLYLPLTHTAMGRDLVQMCPLESGPPQSVAGLASDTFFAGHSYNGCEDPLVQWRHAMTYTKAFQLSRAPISPTVGNIACGTGTKTGTAVFVHLSTNLHRATRTRLGRQTTESARVVDIQPALRLVNDTPCAITVTLNAATKGERRGNLLSLNVAANSNLDVPFVIHNQDLSFAKFSMDKRGYAAEDPVEVFTADWTRFPHSPIPLLAGGALAKNVDTEREISIRNRGRRVLRVGMDFDLRPSAGIAVLRLFPPYMIRNELTDHTLATAIQKGWAPLRPMDKCHIQRLQHNETAMFGTATTDRKDDPDTEAREDKANLYCVASNAVGSINKANAVRVTGHAADEPFLLHTGVVDVDYKMGTQIVGVPCVASIEMCANRLSKAVSIRYRCVVSNFSPHGLSVFMGPPGRAKRVHAEYGSIVVPPRSALPFTQPCRVSSSGTYVYVADMLSVQGALRHARKIPMVPGRSTLIPYGICIDTEGVYEVLVPTEGMGARRVSVKVEIVSGQTHVKVFSTQAATPAAYRVSSVCDFPLALSQSMNVRDAQSTQRERERETTRAEKAEDALGSQGTDRHLTPTVQTGSVPSYTLTRGQVLDFVLHDANMPPVLTMVSMGSLGGSALASAMAAVSGTTSLEHGHVDMRVMGKVQEHKTGGKAANIYSVQVFDGVGRHLFLCPSLRVAQRYLRRYRSGNLSASETSSVVTRMSVGVSMPKMAVFVYNHAETEAGYQNHELMCLSLTGTRVQADVEDDATTVTLSLSSMQLDNQRHMHQREEVLYPVVMRLAPRNQINAVLSNSHYTLTKGECALYISVKGLRTSKRGSHSSVSAELVAVRLDGVYAAVEQSFLEALTAYTDTLVQRLSAVSSNPLLAQKTLDRTPLPLSVPLPTVKDTDPEVMNEGATQTVYLESMSIDDAPICVSVHMTDPLHSLSGGLIESVINTGISVAATENALIRLPAVNAKTVIGSLEQVQNAIVAFYIRSFSRDVLGMLGIGVSTSLLGNAPRALSSLSAGVSELASSDSALTGIMELSRHSVAAVTTLTSNVSGTVSGALVRAASNKAYTERHNAALAASKDSLGAAALHSVAGVADGIITGVTGLALNPIREVKARGAKGLFGGLKKGVFGLVAAPAAGVANVVAYTTASLHSTVSVSSLSPAYAPMVYPAGTAIFRTGQENTQSPGTRGSN
ncbi:vacuolar protein sorting-associated protein 13 [Kipferlia bialata]|uniref:Vacuolar protein sorting-associated protein 13 n=1 Tax=Kipferlia bialata TaxID=797122 RepID=A0A9K3CPJ9_9EUKA|nr:vacuolar protein sorting-associated protein 13 [Kipferlia bialata]|eukprot:g1892.t1